MLSVKSLKPPGFKTPNLHGTLYSQARTWFCYCSVYQWVMIVTKCIMLTAQSVECFYLPLPHTLVSTSVMHYSVLYLLLMVVISTAWRWSFRWKFLALLYKSKMEEQSSLWLHTYKESFKLFLFYFQRQGKKKLFSFSSRCTVKTKNSDFLLL
jgi:hypothetical protein